jgi:hypothetical protein
MKDSKTTVYVHETRFRPKASTLRQTIGYSTRVNCSYALVGLVASLSTDAKEQS